jgi:hypothetical protein
MFLITIFPQQLNIHCIDLNQLITSHRKKTEKGVEVISGYFKALSPFTQRLRTTSQSLGIINNFTMNKASEGRITCQKLWGAAADSMALASSTTSYITCTEQVSSLMSVSFLRIYTPMLYMGLTTPLPD